MSELLERLVAEEAELQFSRLDPGEFAAHGGVVPIRLRGSGVIGAVGVSGRPQQDDHDLVIAELRAYLRQQVG